MSAKKLSPRVRNLLLAGVGAVGVVALFYILASHGIAIGCPFYRLTGLQCPGCGNSRAVMALLRLDIASAFSANWLFALEFFYIGWVLFHCCRAYLAGKRFSYRSPCRWLDWGILAAILVWWVVRNLPV